jgi:hypothetical protein
LGWDDYLTKDNLKKKEFNDQTKRNKQRAKESSFKIKDCHVTLILFLVLSYLVFFFVNNQTETYLTKSTNSTPRLFFRPQKPKRNQYETNHQEQLPITTT